MKIILIGIVFLMQFTSYACPVCERNKPKIIQGITHGSNPDSNWDYVIVTVMIIIAIATLYYSVKWLIKPNENEISHIKNSILNEQ
jgi:hypothetical protein